MVIGFGLYNNGFERLVLFTSMFFFFFFLLVAISLLVLRQRFPHETRPFRVPAYPVTPLLFCAACAFMLYSTVRYALAQDFTHGFYNEGYWGIAVIATGIALASVDWWLERRYPEAANLNPPD
jgi:amino acid transporter